MTSPANQQNPTPATNTSATTATSYASAAGAPKKTAQAPIVATGSHPPVVVGASSSSSSQNAKGASSSPVNGKPAVNPAVPAVARGSSNLNGSGPNHSRKSSVTMAANAPNSFVANGGPVGGAKSGIQFGFDSPAMAHSTPQTGSAAPIPIPGGNPRVPSPAHSPSPIPQPSASGGRPPSGLQQPSGQMTFGSLSSDGERHMRQGSVPANPNAQPGSHFHRESGHSAQGDNAGGAGRGNFQPQGGRGRGGFNPNYNQQMGYPPNNQFRNGPGQGRGMPPAFQPQPRNMPYPNSPQPNRSPALVPSMPNTPNMSQANMQPNMAIQTPPQYHYPPPMAPQHQQVLSPFPPPHPDKLSFKPHKKNKNRRELDKPLQAGRPVDFATSDFQGNDFNQRQRRFSKRADQPWREPDGNGVREGSHNSRMPAESFPSTNNQHPNSARSLDLSPEGGFFEAMLTYKSQNFGYPPPQQQVDNYGRPISMPYAYNNMPYMAPPPANSPGYNQTFAPPYHQQSHSMSRTPSQPERPLSANQQNQPVIVSSTPQPQNAQPKPTPNANFVKPRRSAAIQIKNAAGEVVDTSTFKTPVSPAPSITQSKTPPVVTSTPTPPPKSSTPAHGRTDSHATPKTAKQIQDELKEKIKQATQAPQVAVEEKAKKEEVVKPAEKVVEKPIEQATEKPVEKPVEKPEVTKAEPAPPANDEAEKEPAEEPNKAEPIAEAEEPAQKEAETPAEKVETEEEEMDRIIREMEEADAAREKLEEEHRVKREAEKAAAKIKADEDRKKNAGNEDQKLRDQEREMERLEEEKEKKRAESATKALSVAEALAKARTGAEPKEVDSVTDKLAGMKIGEKASSTAEQKPAAAERRGKPAALDLTPILTKPIEPPQPSAALQSLKSARFLKVIEQDIYPAGIKSPNPSLNAAVAKKGKTFKYDANFLLQFQKVFTEQPSLEFHQQVKTLIGDGDGGRSASNRGGQTPGSARQNSRGGGGFPMGSFGAPTGGRTLPTGTTSADRFAMANNPMARPQVNPMASFQRPGGAFPSSASMSRTSSQSNLPNSPRQSSRNTRGSRRNDYNPKDAQAAKTMPLTAGMELKPIAVTSNGWKPSSLTSKAGASAPPPGTAPGYLDPQMVQRKVKAALNKMTPEKFDRIADQILEIASQSKDETDGRTLRQVIQLTFEKATDEAHWASMYAKFCKRMLETMSPDVRDERIKDKNGNVVNGGNLFRKYLLNRCQEEFERGWTTNLPEPKEVEGDSKKPGEAALLSDEYYIAAAAKRRGLGLVQFIGELYKLGMLTERIMHECVHKLVDYKGVPDETEIESLSKLLRTIGANLDATEKGRPMMDAYFQRIQTMADLPDLPSRLRFMLMDVVDLRRARWVSKETNKGPKTLDEVRAEAEAAQALKAQESARGNQRGGGRPPAGRGDARHFSAGYTQQQSNQVGMDDLRRLKGSANRTSSGNVTLGPTSMFSSRSNSGRRLGPGGSLGRAGEDSGASSRTGTPPHRETTSHSNAFSLLANMETEHPASPPSTSASPMISKAVPDSGKKESE
ncbi:Eukaryotic translation initiation factor 4 gamma [Neonectria ditissima]|uniref:Eukaryotic translation initiation factor 4 gamma n=1 Tax=Neonectria ditissima TaxID=78410 RepID=A0A0P7BH00_9HYPO|nr:Eukaryotic translation initiation factor 4 gamma [Neonectria ditissima]